jgi:hypothetical protein
LPSNFLIFYFYLQSENPSNARSLPGVAKTVQFRTNPPNNTRNYHRSRTDPTFLNLFQTQTRITASIVVPTLNIEPQATWATSVAHPMPRTKPYRLSTIPNPPPIATGIIEFFFSPNNFCNLKGREILIDLHLLHYPIYQ